MTRALVCVAAVSASFGARAAEPPIALLPVVSDGLPSDQVARVEKLLRASAERTFGGRLQKDVLTRARLEASEARGLGCDRGTAFRRPLVPDCLVAAGVGVETERVLAVRATRSDVAGKPQVRLEALLFDVVEAKPIRRVARRIALTDDAMNDALARLFDDELAGAVLVVNGATAGTTIALDGGPAQPVPERIVIEAGAHRVVLTPAAPGEARVHEIDVESGTQVELDANAASSLPTPPAAVSADAPGTTGPATASGAGDTGGSVAPYIAAGVSGGVAVLGGALFGVGLIPRVGYSGDAVALARLQADVADDPKKQHDAAADIRAKRASLEGNAQAWETWGVPLVVIGSSLFSAGVVGAIAFAVAPMLAGAGATEDAPAPSAPNGAPGASTPDAKTNGPESAP